MHRRVIGRESAQVAKELAARAVDGKVYVKAQPPIPAFAMWDYTDGRAVARVVCVENLSVALSAQAKCGVSGQQPKDSHAIYEKRQWGF